MTQVERLALLSTRITNFRVSPTKVAVGETVTIAGTLQWHTPILCFWNALEGKGVEIIADTTKLGEVSSGSGGGFRFTWTPKSVGVYWVRAKFPGDLIIYNGCESQTLRVDVITKEQKQLEEMQFWALVGVGAATVLAVTGAVIYHFERSREMELILARRR
jgi:hypothetical protein